MVASNAPDHRCVWFVMQSAPLIVGFVLVAPVSLALTARQPDQPVTPDLLQPGVVKRAPDAAVRAGAGSPVPYPHPLITEVLYAVPGGKTGDANNDGNRSANGDEFVEIVNPHDKPIELEGYRISDGAPTRQASVPKEGEPAKEEESNRVEFVFPKLTLQPGEVAVVFNGFESRIPGNVGTSVKSAEKNELFANAYVFTMACENQYQAFSNQNDMVLLSSPKGAGVQCVRWDNREDARAKPRSQPAKDGDGKSAPRRPSDKVIESPAELVEAAPFARGSVQRGGVAGAFKPHPEVDGTPASPGVFKVVSGTP
jgi:hypothetical protein